MSGLGSFTMDDPFLPEKRSWSTALITSLLLKAPHSLSLEAQNLCPGTQPPPSFFSNPALPFCFLHCALASRDYSLLPSRTPAPPPWLFAFSVSYTWTPPAPIFIDLAHFKCYFLHCVFCSSPLCLHRLRTKYPHRSWSLLSIWCIPFHCIIFILFHLLDNGLQETGCAGFIFVSYDFCTSWPLVHVQYAFAGRRKGKRKRRKEM